MDSLFHELKKKIHKENNSNLHYNVMPTPTRQWIYELCEMVDERLKELERRQMEMCSCCSKLKDGVDV